MYEDLIIMLMGMGVAITAGITVMLIEVGRKSWPVTYVSIEDRQNGRIAILKKAKEMKFKDGSKGWVSKPTILGSGIGALFAKPTPVNPMERATLINNKSGGAFALSCSPCENIELPVEIHTNKKEAEMIVQYIDVSNWYREALKKTALAPILNPKEGFFNKHPSAAIIMGGLIVIIMLVIFGTIIQPFLTQNNAALASTVANVISQFNNLGVSAGNAVSGVNVIQ